MLVIVFLSSTATAADTQKRLVDKATVVDQVVSDDRPQQAQDNAYTVYPVAKKKGDPMHGDYTIGMTGMYLTFALALTDLNTNGIDGDVNLLVQGDYDAVLLGETFPITFRATIPGSGTFKITVKPAPGATATIAASSFYTALVNLDSMKNMVFDGFNGTDNFKLSIVANGTRAATGRTVSVWNGCQFIDFKNMIFKTAAGGSSPNWRNIDISGKNTIDGGIKDVNIDNCQFADNGLGGAEVQIYVSGYNAFDYTERINITNCEIYNWNGLGTFTGAGIQVRYGVKDCLIENNELYVATPSGSIEGGLRGITLGGTSDILENITIKDNNIHDLVSTTNETNCYAIQVSGPTTTAALAAPKNIVIDGNTISNIKGTYKSATISALGIVFGNSGQDVTISNNHISDIGGSGLQPEGIRVGYSTSSIYSVDNCQIIGNTVDGVVAGYAGTWSMGIQTGYVTNLSILKNKVTNIGSTFSGNSPAGILLFGASGKVQTALIANNFVYFPTASATVSDGWRVGIFDYGYTANAADIYYNSVYIGGTNFDATEASLAFNRGNDNVANVKNNIFYNARGGAGYNVGAGDDSLGGTFTSNNNDIYANPGVLGYVGTADATTLAEWQTLTGGQDMNSISEVPTFVGDTDLHIKVGTLTGLENAGTPVSVLDDFDGDVRGLGKVAPDIGADEFETGAPGAFANISPANSAIDIAINGNLTWDASQFAYSYDVYLDKVDASTLVDNVTGTSYTYAGLDGLTGYFWKVIAKNDINTTLATGAPYTFTTAALPPNAPSDIVLSNIATSGLDVSWTDNSLDEDGFKVYTATIEAGPYTLAATVGADVVTAPVSGLSANTRYYFKVTAYHTVQGESDPAVANVATLASLPTAPRLSSATRRSISIRQGLTDGNPLGTTLYAFSTADESKWVTANNTLGDTPVWRTSTEWLPVGGTAIRNLFPSTSYVLKAKAKNLDGVETGFGDPSTLATLAPFDAFPVTEGFETAVPPTDWEVIDVAGDASGGMYGSWFRATTTLFKGTGVARYLWEETGVNGADDWLINQPMTFTAGTSYIISFYVRTYGADEQMKVTIGDAPTPAAQTTILADYNPMNMTAYTFKGIVFTVPTTGTYYIGFHAYTPVNQYWIRMDEVKVAVANPTDVAFLGLAQTTGIRPMKTANVGEKTEEIVEVPFDRSRAKPTVFNKPSDINNTLLVTGPVNTSYKLQGFLGQDAVAEAFNSNDGILKATPSPVNLRAQLANIGVNAIPGFTINYSVDEVAQPSYAGGVIPVGTDVFADMPFATTSRGMFDAVAAAVVVGEGDPSNDTLRVPLMVYPTPSYNLRYDNYGPNSYVWGVSDPYADAKTAIGIRYTNTVRGRVGQIDLLTNSNRRTGGTYLNTIIPEVWTITVRGAGPNDDTPGAILYTKQFTGPKYNTLASTVKTLALGDDAPVIEAGQNFWVTATAESCGATTGGYVFGLYAKSSNAASLLPGAEGRSYASDYVVEDWYYMGEAVFGAGDYGHWPMRTIMVPVSNSISGVVYHDLNGNGSKDVGEPGLEGWEVKITGNLNLTTLTNVDGIYEFNALENGTFTLSETIQSGWACVTPGTSGEYTVVLAGDESVVRDFGNFKSTSVSGIVWKDVNHNGSLDAGEVGIDGVEVSLNSATTTTAGGGLYSYPEVYGGSYTLSAAAPTGMYQTYPTVPVAFDVTSGMDPIVKNFGFNTEDDLIMYRSFLHEDIVALDSKGKVPKAVKKTKNDKVEFELELTVPAHTPADFTTLHLEYGAAPFATTDIKYPGQTFPAQVVKKNDVVQVLGVDYTLTGVIDGKLKKFDYVFTTLTGGDVINIHGYVKASKPIKAKYWWLPVNVDPKESIVKIPLLATDPAWEMNQPRIPMPTYANLIDEVYADAGWFQKGMVPTDSLVVGIVRADSPKVYGWVWLPKPADVQKSLYDKVGLTHDGDARYFDFLKLIKPFVKQQKSLPPKVHDNKLFAEIVALKLAIAASVTQHIPLGFGELVYHDTSSAYAAFNGKMVKEIAAEASAAMTAKTSTWGDAVSFFDVIRKINEAFDGPIDSASFAGVTVFTGVAELKEVPYLISDPTIAKAVITPSLSYNEVPNVFELSQNYPNPFNPTTNIQFILPEDAIVTLKVYNILGQEVATLASKELFTEGMNDVEFDASRLSSGVYFYQISVDGVGENAGKFTQVKKMVLMK